MYYTIIDLVSKHIHIALDYLFGREINLDSERVYFNRAVRLNVAEQRRARGQSRAQNVASIGSFEGCKSMLQKGDLWNH